MSTKIQIIMDEDQVLALKWLVSNNMAIPASIRNEWFLFFEERFPVQAIHGDESDIIANYGLHEIEIKKIKI